MGWHSDANAARLGEAGKVFDHWLRIPKVVHEYPDARFGGQPLSGGTSKVETVCGSSGQPLSLPRRRLFIPQSPQIRAVSGGVVHRNRLSI